MQLWSSGSASLWCAGYHESPRLLGFCKEAPQIHINDVLTPVECDVSGKVPFEKVVSGETGSVDGLLTLFNFSVLQSIQNRASSRAATVAMTTSGGTVSAPGTLQPGQLGTLVQTEGGAFTLWVLFHRAGAAIFQTGVIGPLSGGNMPRGYRFPVCTLAPETIIPSSTDATKVHIAIDAMPQWNPTVNIPGTGFGSQTCYDNDCSAVLALAVA